MTREEIALAALQGMLSNIKGCFGVDFPNNNKTVCIAAFEVADAFIAVRDAPAEAPEGTEEAVAAVMERGCGTCMHISKMTYEEPCRTCVATLPPASKWEPRT